MQSDTGFLGRWLFGLGGTGMLDFRHEIAEIFLGALEGAGCLVTQVHGVGGQVGQGGPQTVLVF